MAYRKLKGSGYAGVQSTKEIYQRQKKKRVSSNAQQNMVCDSTIESEKGYRISFDFGILDTTFLIFVLSKLKEQGIIVSIFVIIYILYKSYKKEYI